MNSAKEKPASTESVNKELILKVVLPFGFLLAGWSTLWAVYNNFVPVFLQAGNPVFDKGGAAVTYGFGLSAFAAGLLMSIDNLLNLISGPFVGRWSDKTGKRLPFIRWSVPLAILCFLALPFVVKLIPSESNGNLSQLLVPFSMMCVLVLVIVVGSVFSGVPAYALRYQLIPSKIRSQATGYIELIGAFGSVLAYALSGVLYQINAVLPFIVFGGLFMLAIFYFLAVVKEPTHWTPAAETSVEGRSLKDVLDVFQDFSPKQKMNVLLVMLIGFLFNFGIGPIATYGSSYVVNVLELSEGMAASMGAIFFIGYLLGTVPMGYLPKWITRRGALMLGAGIAAVSALVIILAPNFTLLQIMVGIMGFGFAAPQVILYPVLSDIVPNEKSFGAMIGLLIFSLALATTISVPFWGKMIDIFRNYELVWVAVVLAAALAIVTSFFLSMGEAKEEQS